MQNTDDFFDAINDLKLSQTKWNRAIKRFQHVIDNFKALCSEAPIEAEVEQTDDVTVDIRFLDKRIQVKLSSLGLGHKLLAKTSISEIIGDQEAPIASYAFDRNGNVHHLSGDKAVTAYAPDEENAVFIAAMKHAAQRGYPEIPA